MIFIANFFDAKRFSTHRSGLMGVAILLIMLFHFASIDYLFIGVDIFLFLSAFGLCFSLEKESSLLSFYKRRFKRIIPVWFLVLLLVHLIGLISFHFSLDTHFDTVPHNVWQSITWYTGLGYWIVNFVPVETPLEWFYEWYVPALLLFYFITPWLFKQKNIVLIAIILVALVINPYIVDHLPYNNSLQLSLFRIPIFLVGILYYRMLSKSISFHMSIIILSCLIGVVLFFGSFFEIINIAKTYIFLFIVQFVCIVITHFLDWMNLNRMMSFLGGISLELYLIHLYNRPIYLVKLMFDDRIIVLIISFVICVIVAYLLHLVVSYLYSKMTR